MPGIFKSRVKGIDGGYKLSELFSGRGGSTDAVVDVATVVEFRFEAVVQLGIKNWCLIKHELKVRQNLLDSDYEMYMVRLLVATVNWHKPLLFAKKSNITLLSCLFMILAVSMITLIMLYHVLARFEFQFIYLL